MNPEQFTVRPLRETDLDDWFRLRHMLWDGTSDNDHKSEMIDILDHHETQFVLIAEAAPGRLVGFLEASIRPFVEDCDTDHVGYLEGWYVEPEFRKMGIGRKLVRHAEEWARERGCTEMASDAELGNDSSLAAHLNLGYKETSRLVHLRKDL
ncbi:MAG TPA: aminoglycoside 6'-N-acetyltransferase [Pyrinomonadaceae bacterium]|nr:aminoglycoside 6'-N-acetyltransferase [Pyrinomonadaceae bacterium]